MKKDILIIAHFCSDFDIKGNNRFNYLTDVLSENYSHVELVTSDFSHDRKKKRDKSAVKCNYKVTFISEPGYTRNISLTRLYSHYIFGRNIKKYLNVRKKPDVIYCSVPSLNVAKVAAEYAKKNNIKLIIDIQDLWPEAFKMVINVPIFNDILFSPMKRQANYIYAAADEIVAVSETYLNKALESIKKPQTGHSLYLGTDLSQFDNFAQTNKFSDKPKDQIWLAYVGTLGHSYNLFLVIDALEIITTKSNINIRFIVMGNGPLKSKFQDYAKRKKVNVEFAGRLSYEKMVGILTTCDIAINPIRKGSAGSIINKVCDYAAAGLPVINTQECNEYRNLLDKYNAGFNCINDNATDVANKLLLLMSNSTKRREMGLNNRKLASEIFDRKRTYRKILELIE